MYKDVVMNACDRDIDNLDRAWMDEKICHLKTCWVTTKIFLYPSDILTIESQ